MSKIVTSENPCRFCGIAKALEKLDFSGIECRNENSEPCTACRELRDLDTKIEEAAANLQELVHRRCELKTRRNLHHDQLVKNLPTEILSKVFVFCHPYYCFTERTFGEGQFPTLRPDKSQSTHFGVAPVILGSVCHRWREIVEATPQLWDSVPINLHQSDFQYTRFIEKWLSRSGGFGLTLGVYEGKRRAENADPGGLITIVNAHCSRWKSLDVSVRAYFLRQLRCDPSCAPNLESLRLREHSADWSTTQVEFNIDNEFIPGPKNIFLSGITSEFIGIAWNQVIHMDLTDITVAEFLAILAKSPNINILCARSIKRAPHEQTFSPPSHPITHPAIKTVRLYENNYSEKFDMLFDHITLPSLQEFLIKQSISPRLTAMLSRSLPPLTGLTIIASSITRETMRVFMATPHAMELDLRCQNIPASFFKRLGSTSSFSPSDRVQLLPVLSSLKMRCEHKFPWACVADMFGQRPVLQGLGPESIYRPLRTFALVITKGTIWAGTDYENDIEPVDNETLQRLRALEMAGISISISDRHGEDLLSEIVCGDGTSAED